MNWKTTIGGMILALGIAGSAQADHHMASGNIVETAQEAGQFETLLAAAEAAGLVEALSGEGPLTVFAPTDEAFAALPEGTVEGLLEPENRDQLVAILTYHVVDGSVMAGDIAEGESEVATLNEDAMLTVEKSGDSVMVGEATVVQADVEAENGVIHVIDQVLMPN